MRVIATVLSLALLQTPLALPPTRDQFLATFGNYLDSLRVQAGIPGLAVAIVEGDSLAWDAAFGQQDLSRSLAARSDTTFQFDGLTQLLTATLVLQCVEQGKVKLDAPIGTFAPGSVEASATVAQILSHTSGDPADPTFSYRPDRVDVLGPVVTTCTGLSFRRSVAALLDRSVMYDSVPGPDAVSDPSLPAEVARYTSLLGRLAVPYALDSQGRASASRYVATTLTPSTGLISTVLDFAKFDRSLRQGILLRADTLSTAWRGVAGRNGSLPYGLGWFVQSYNGEQVVWQFGIGANASSSMIITMPGRGITLIMVANSDALAKPASLSGGDITASPFARLFFQLIFK